MQRELRPILIHHHLQLTFNHFSDETILNVEIMAVRRRFIRVLVNPIPFTTNRCDVVLEEFKLRQWGIIGLKTWVLLLIERISIEKRTTTKMTITKLNLDNIYCRLAVELLEKWLHQPQTYPIVSQRRDKLHANFLHSTGWQKVERYKCWF